VTATAAPAAPTLGQRADRLVRSLALTRHGLVGLSVARIAFGSVILLDLAIHVADRQTLWGPDGWYDHARMERDQQLGISLFNLGESAWLTDVLYLAYAAVAVLFVVGWRTGVVTPALLVLMWTFQERNPYLINGGDNLVRIVLFYLMFARLNAYLAPGARERRAAEAQARAEAEAAGRPVRGVLATVAHNTALGACIAQLCVLYLASAMFKTQGEMWQEGTAVYYITRVAEYNAWPELSAIFIHSPVAVTVATYLAVFVQMAFPFALVNRYARHTVFVLLVGMHAGIGLLMGLPVFSAFMVAADLLLFTDAEWRRGAARVRAAVARVREAQAAWAADREPRAVPATTMGQVQS
jgi:hypothetical protein